MELPLEKVNNSTTAPNIELHNFSIQEAEADESCVAKTRLRDLFRGHTKRRIVGPGPQ